MMEESDSDSTVEQFHDCLSEVNDDDLEVPEDTSTNQQWSDPEYSVPLEYNHESDEEDLSPLPPSPPTIFYPVSMSDSSITSALNEAAKIKKLNGPDDWVEWNRKLRGHLEMVSLWEVLTGERPAPAADTAEHTVWKTNQDKLSALLLLITGPSALSLIESKSDKTATEQYTYLKDTYDTYTIQTYSTHCCTHRTVRQQMKYFES